MSCFLTGTKGAFEVKGKVGAGSMASVVLLISTKGALGTKGKASAIDASLIFSTEIKSAVKTKE